MEKRRKMERVLYRAGSKKLQKRPDQTEVKTIEVRPNVGNVRKPEATGAAEELLARQEGVPEPKWERTGEPCRWRRNDENEETGPEG